MCICVYEALLYREFANPLLYRGCVLTPTLFTLKSSMMLQQTAEDHSNEDGIYIHSCTDGSLFNLGPLQAHTKTTEKLIRELLFADAAALVAHREPMMQ